MNRVLYRQIYFVDNKLELARQWFLRKSAQLTGAAPISSKLDIRHANCTMANMLLQAIYSNEGHPQHIDTHSESPAEKV